MITCSKGIKDTRRRILETAYEEFYRHGFQSGSLNRIVADAGVTKGALFHHYDGKQALGYAVVQEIVGSLIRDVWIEPLSRSADPIRDIQKIVRGVIRRGAGSGLTQGCPLNNLAQEMSPLDEGFRRRLESIYIAWRESVEVAIARGIEAGSVRKDIRPRRVAGFIVASMTGIIGTAKNAKSRELMAEAGDVLIQFLDTLAPDKK
jgi:AcrR family transcriptional regulator